MFYMQQIISVLFLDKDGGLTLDLFVEQYDYNIYAIKNILYENNQECSIFRQRWRPDP